MKIYAMLRIKIQHYMWN